MFRKGRKASSVTFIRCKLFLVSLKDAGDFASVCFWILKPRCPEKGTMTIQEVNTCLDKIAASNAAKEKAGVKKNLEHMLRNMSAREQKWLIRMVLKEMKMGLSQQSVFSVYHQDAEDLFNVKMSMDKVCYGKFFLLMSSKCITLSKKASYENAYRFQIFIDSHSSSGVHNVTRSQCQTT